MRVETRVEWFLMIVDYNAVNFTLNLKPVYNTIHGKWESFD